jgi:TatD DNase family protein
MTDVTPSPARLVDIGANLTHDSFDADRAEVIARARRVGVGRFVVTGSDVAHSRRALDLCRDYPGLHATAGVHPHHAKDVTAETPAELRRILEDSQVVAVGECGLDYFHNFSPQDVQRQVFEMQLELAETCRKPAFLHQRTPMRTS